VGIYRYVRNILVVIIITFIHLQTVLKCKLIQFFLLQRVSSMLRVKIKMYVMFTQHEELFVARKHCIIHGF
jgi:hypothetical protein